MKPLKTILTLAAALTLTAALQACDDDDDNNNFCGGDRCGNALVTLRPTGDSQFSMWVADNVYLHASNIPAYPFGDRQVRALIAYSATGNFPWTPDEHNSVTVLAIDTILTKDPVKLTPATPDDELTGYGNDPIAIFADWLTVIEDDYLTLHMTAYWGQPSTRHRINLIAGLNPDDPYDLLLCHDACGDDRRYTAEAIAAFSLRSLPDTGGKAVTLTLRWQSDNGQRSAKFRYQTGHTLPAEDLSQTSATFAQQTGASPAKAAANHNIH